MVLQRTLKRTVTLTGVGLHSGQPATITLKPAFPNTGITFIRTDLKGSPEIKANYKNVVSTQLATTLGRGKASVSTVEHVLAALQLLGVDNATIEVNGPEVPILDGSAEPFCEAIEAEGLQTQLKGRSFLYLRRRVELKIAEKWAVAEPASRLEVHGSVDWDHPAIGYQEYHYVEGKTPSCDLSSARTFGFLRDVEMLKRMGLAKGGSLDNAVVLDDARVLNPDGLRYADEFARHKVLDALGDFKLSGVIIQAYIRLHRAGHDLHSQLLAEIFKNPDNYEIVDGSEREERSEALALASALARSFIASV